MFHLNLELHSSGFGATCSDGDAEIARILDDLARRIRDGGLYQGQLADNHGNIVGWWKCNHPQEKPPF